jgi:hypothetical protein
MVAVVLNAAVSGGALVVGMPKEAVEVGHDEWLAGLLPTRHRVQSLQGQLVEQIPNGPLAGGVRLECPCHQRTAYRIDVYRTYLDSIENPTNIEVSSRSLPDGSARLRLLHAALDDFIRQVLGVELFDRAHDAVHQRTRGRLVDVLGAAHERCAGLSDGNIDLNVIESIAGQAIYLVNNDVLDGVPGDEGEKPLQLCAMCRLCAFAPVNELVDHLRFERLRLAGARVALSRNREALEESWN